MAALVDTNVLVYRFDSRFPEKQRVATELLRRGIADDAIRLPHQAILEFVAVATRPIAGGARPLCHPERRAARRRSSSRSSRCSTRTRPSCGRPFVGAGAYGLSWFDAHLWAFAEHYGLAELLSEDFEHDRMYGTVRVVNPFR